MSTPLTDAITALTTYSNSVTGASDTTLSDAVATLAEGYGQGGWTADDIAKRLQPSGDITLTVSDISERLFEKCPITSVSAVNCTSIGTYAFMNCTELISVYAPALTKMDISAFESCSKFAINNFAEAFPVLESILHYCFKRCYGITGTLILPASIKELQTQAFIDIKATQVRFLGTPTTINATAFAGCRTITDIYVPWSDGDVANSPWGATNATIHYNTTFDSNGDIVSAS